MSGESCVIGKWGVPMDWFRLTFSDGTTRDVCVGDESDWGDLKDEAFDPDTGDEIGFGCGNDVDGYKKIVKVEDEDGTVWTGDRIQSWFDGNVNLWVCCYSDGEEMTHEALIAVADRLMPDGLRERPSAKEKAVYEKVMSYYAGNDLWDRLVKKLLDGDSGITPDNILDVYWEAEEVDYSDFDDRMGEAYWDRVEENIAEALQSVEGKN